MICLSSQVAQGFWVGIDPGSISVGLSLFHRRKLVDYRVVKAKSGDSAEIRILKLRDSVQSELTRMLGFAPKSETHAILELPGNQTKQRSGSLIALGMAVGAMACVLHERNYASLEFVDVSTWSRLDGGVCKSKKHRALYLPRVCPEYSIDNDPGFDAADAIGLIAWRLGMYDGHKEQIKQFVIDRKPIDKAEEEAELIAKAERKEQRRIKREARERSAREKQTRPRQQKAGRRRK